MREIIFIRHGRAETNQADPETAIVGSDLPLTPEGIRQVHRTARRLGNLVLNNVIGRPGAVYSSPFMRAYQSAAIIGARLNLPVIDDVRLREVDKGSWVGKRVKDVTLMEDEIPSVERATHRPPEGENWSDLADRMTDFIFEHEAEPSFIVVSHDHPILCAVGRLTGQPMSQWEDNPLITGGLRRVVDKNGYWSVDTDISN